MHMTFIHIQGPGYRVHAPSVARHYATLLSDVPPCRHRVIAARRASSSTSRGQLLRFCNTETVQRLTGEVAHEKRTKTPTTFCHVWSSNTQI
jgi:hypothetical protein